MGWLIDTSIWIAVERGKLSAADIHTITRQESVYLSPINIAEIRFGVELLRSSAQQHRAMAMLRRLRRKPQLRITVQTAETFGMLAAKIKKAGKEPNVRINDLWLAAQAIQRDLSLLTANAKDFADIPELKVISIKL